MERGAKGPGHNPRSGKSPVFKMVGSSPVKRKSFEAYIEEAATREEWEPKEVNTTYEESEEQGKISINKE